MLYSFFLPTLFGLTALVGLIMLFNGIRGIVKQRIYIPDFRTVATGTVRVETGEIALSWGINSVIAGSVILIIVAYGFYQIDLYFNSPAFVRNLVAPPERAETLYSLVSENGYEIALGYQKPIPEIREAFKRKLIADGWAITRDTPVSMIVQKSPHVASLSFLGWKEDSRGPFKSKVLITYSSGRAPF